MAHSFAALQALDIVACHAIRCSFVDTVGDLKVSPVGPFNKTLCPASPSLQWVLWASVPHLPGQGLTPHLDHRYYDPLRLPNARLGVVRSSLSSPDTLYRPSLRLSLPHSTSAGLVEGRDIPPQRRDFALGGWISSYRLLTQGSMWTSQVPKLPP